MSLTIGIMRLVVSALVLGVFCLCSAADLASKPHPAAQAAADVVREVAQADICFLPAGLLKEPMGDLATLLQFPSEPVVLLRLTGSEVKLSLERSVSSAPAPSSAFLQVSGVTVTYSEGASPDGRIIEIRVGDTLLTPERQYLVAMPETLARGALGYFKIWDKSKAVRTTQLTLEEMLKGKSGLAKSPRYIAKA